MEGFIKEIVGIAMVMLGVEIVAAQRVKEAARDAQERTEHAEAVAGHESA
jgi:hypothetical protein